MLSLVNKLDAFNVKVAINAPVEKVWRYVEDLERLEGWLLPGGTIEKTSSGPLAVGSTFELKEEMPPYGSSRVEYVVTDYVPNRRLVVEAQSGTTRPRFFVEVQWADGGTELAAWMEPSYGVPRGLLLLVGILFLPLMLPMVLIPRWCQGRKVRRIKSWAEAEE